ncbi:hypothetical protein JW930_02870 [Candidatus Woesearchaeota archaeon]|nr:hypothetical protein [Candidatus Woesearchaeota archaeon]
MVSVPFVPKKENKLESQIEAIKKKKVSELNVGERLIKFGFIDDEASAKLKKPVPFQENTEIVQHNIAKTDFPAPLRSFRLILEYPDLNIEQMYYWFIRHFQEQWGCERVEKVIDTLASSVSSSLFGNLQTRLGAQQNQASQYLKGISEMIKGLFQIVREVRVIEDRLSYYYDSEKENGELALSSEIVLKGLWIDQVEGGAKNPSSVYGLSQTVGFTIIPDLFFRTKPMKKNEIERVVNAMKFNEKVKEVLKRKLRQYYEWKERTFKELETRKNFEIKYLRQHYNTIQLYMSWITPYLRNVKRLQLYEKNMKRPEIINAFETQIIEIETLFIRTDENHYKNSRGVVASHFIYRVRPELAFHSYEYQHKGPIHVGQADITLRAYSWNDAQIEAYKKYREEEDFQLMGSINESVQAAMDALGGELKKYLSEKGEEFGEKKQEEKVQKKLPSVLDPFIGVFGGVGDIFKSLAPKTKGAKKKKTKPSYKEEVGKKHAGHFAMEACQVGYQKFKEGPGSCIYYP